MKQLTLIEGPLDLQEWINQHTDPIVRETSTALLAEQRRLQVSRMNAYTRYHHAPNASTRWGLQEAEQRLQELQPYLDDVLRAYLWYNSTYPRKYILKEA